MLSRRALIKASAAFSCIALSPRLAARATANARYASSYRGHDGRYHVAVFDHLGQSLHTQALPARAHSFAIHPSTQDIICFARRPGSYFTSVDAFARAETVNIESPVDRHFYGHGVFSQDGETLYTTENDFDNQRGVIGMYDASRGYVRIGELDSFGIGPHEITRLPGTDILAVALGGILTHPDTGRAKLNLETMRPALLYIEANTGKLLEKVELPAQASQCSIRHLACNARGEIVFVCQDQAKGRKSNSLIGLHTLGKPLRIAPLSPELSQLTDGYLGSVAFDASGDYFCTSSPRGNLILVYEYRSGRMIAKSELEDVCGCAPSHQPGQFIVSNGLGQVAELTLLPDESLHLNTLQANSQIRWDNHIVALTTHSQIK